MRQFSLQKCLLNPIATVIELLLAMLLVGVNVLQRLTSCVVGLVYLVERLTLKVVVVPVILLL